MRGEAPARRPGLLIALHAACFWPVWQWYVERLDDGSDEPWGLAALIAALALSWPRAGFRLDPRDPLLGAAAVLTLLYAALPWAPPLVRAVVAMAALGASWVSVTGARNRSAAIVALLVLSVPVIASLQFYAGYPLRIATAAGATELLNFFGGDVIREATSMSVGDRVAGFRTAGFRTAGFRTVIVDAPCSGVRMLWTAAVLACVLAALRPRVGWRAMALSLALVLPVVLATNAVRAALLFLLETRAQPAPPLLHSLVGVVIFMMTAALLVASDHLQCRARHARRAALRMAVSAS